MKVVLPEGYIAATTYTGTVVHALKTPLARFSSKAAICGQMPNQPWSWFTDPKSQVHSRRALGDLPLCRRCSTALKVEASS